jgi:nucleoid DNA-binding protein
MNKLELVRKIYNKHNGAYKLSDVNCLVNDVFSEIKDTVQKEDKVVVSNFGTFLPKKMAAKRIVNIHTKEEMFLESRYKAGFNASPAFNRDMP